MAEKRACINCGRKMKQQFIGLKHCKCGTSWKKDIGYFERTPNMVFALERRQKDKKGKTKQVPSIRMKEEVKSDMGAICKICNGDKLKVDGCVSLPISHKGKQYEPIKVGDPGDFDEGCDLDMRCHDCGAKCGHYHHPGCDAERCPVCYEQLIGCDCEDKDEDGKPSSPVLTQMTADMYAGKVDTVIVKNISRIGEDVSQSIEFLDRAESLGIEVISIDEDAIDTPGLDEDKAET